MQTADPWIADLHCDTVMRVAEGADLRRSDKTGHIDLPRLREGKVGLQAFASFVAPNTVGAYKDVSAKIATIDSLCSENPDDLELVSNAADIIRIAESGRTGVLLTIENGHAIENELSNLEKLRQRGVRSMTLVHGKNLDWIASCSEEQCAFDGLTSFGSRVVDAMCDLGMVVDVSHAHKRAFWKVARQVRRKGFPLIASHSNAWEICNHPRNLKVNQIREIADTGGVIGVNFFPLFLDENYRVAWNSGNKEQLGKVTVDSAVIANHIDFIVDLVGDDTVAFGSDFDGIPSTPSDVTGADAYPTIIAELRRRGYGDGTIEKIAWKNALRVLRAYD